MLPVWGCRRSNLWLTQQTVDDFVVLSHNSGDFFRWRLQFYDLSLIWSSNMSLQGYVIKWSTDEGNSGPVWGWTIFLCK